MKKLFLYLLVTLLAFYPTNNFAGNDNDCRKDPRFKHIIKELNLTEKQKEDISKIRSEYQKKIIDLKADLQKVRIDLKDEMRKVNLDEAKILSLNSKISDLHASIRESRTKMWLDSYKILDDKQKEIWKNSSVNIKDGMRKFKSKMNKFREHFRN